MTAPSWHHIMVMAARDVRHQRIRRRRRLMVMTIIPLTIILTALGGVGVHAQWWRMRADQASCLTAARQMADSRAAAQADWKRVNAAGRNAGDPIGDPPHVDCSPAHAQANTDTYRRMRDSYNRREGVLRAQ